MPKANIMNLVSATAFTLDGLLPDADRHTKEKAVLAVLRKLCEVPEIAHAVYSVSGISFDIKGIFTDAMKVSAVIKKESDGYHVRSEEGKNLGGPYKTREEAEKRLRQVEYFKHKKAAKNPDAKTGDEINLVGNETKQQIINLLIEHKAKYGSSYLDEWSLKKESKPELLKYVKVFNENKRNGGDGNASLYYNGPADVVAEKITEIFKKVFEKYGINPKDIPEDVREENVKLWDAFRAERLGWLDSHDLPAVEKFVADWSESYLKKRQPQSAVAARAESASMEEAKALTAPSQKPAVAASAPRELDGFKVGDTVRVAELMAKGDDRIYKVTAIGSDDTIYKGKVIFNQIFSNGTVSKMAHAMKPEMLEKVKAQGTAAAKSSGDTDETYAEFGDSRFYRVGDNFYFSDRGNVTKLKDSQADEIRGALADRYVKGARMSDREMIDVVRQMVKDMPKKKHRWADASKADDDPDTYKTEGVKKYGLSRKNLDNRFSRSAAQGMKQAAKIIDEATGKLVATSPETIKKYLADPNAEEAWVVFDDGSRELATQLQGKKVALKDGSVMKVATVKAALVKAQGNDEGQRLYELQDSTVEHKLPVRDGNASFFEEAAGDVFREMATRADGGYVSEKIRRLLRFGDMNQADVEQTINAKRNMDAQKMATYKANLAALKQATEASGHANKATLLQAIAVQEAIVAWLENPANKTQATAEAAISSLSKMAEGRLGKMKGGMPKQVAAKKGPYPHATLQMNKMGHIHAWPGSVEVIGGWGGSKYLGAYKGEELESPVYFQTQDDIEAVRDALPPEEWQHLDSGFALTTEFFPDDYFGEKSLDDMVEEKKREEERKDTEKKMATRAELEQKHGAATKDIAERAIGITQAVRRMFGGVHATIMKAYTDQIGVKARQLYNETHTQNWTTNEVPYVHLDKMSVRSAIDDLQNDIRKTDIPVGLARIMANRLLDALRGLRQAIDNL